MKKFALGLSCMAIFLTAVSPVYADESTVTYTEDSSWIVKIPDKIELQKDKPTVEKITATDMNIRSGYRLRIRVKTGIQNYRVKLKRSSGTSEINVFASTDSEGKNGIFTGSTSIVQFVDQNTSAYTGGEIHFAPVSKENPNADAGSYEGTLTFIFDLYNPPAIGS